MLVSECKECGERYYGWALQTTEHQYCTKCGATLIVCNEADSSRVEPTESFPLPSDFAGDRGLPHITSANQNLGNVDFETKLRHWFKYKPEQRIHKDVYQ